MTAHEGTLNPVTVVVEAKPWWKSITILANVVGVLIMFLTSIAELEFLQNVPYLESWVIGALGVLNVILRVVKTVGPVTVLGKVMAPLRTEELKHYGGGPATKY